MMGAMQGLGAAPVEGVMVETFHIATPRGNTPRCSSSAQGPAILRDAYDLLGRSESVPLIKGHGIAVAFTLAGRYHDLESVRLLVTFPELRPPDGLAIPRIDRTQECLLVDGVRMVVFAYTFDEAWELVEGTWCVSIYDGEHELGQARITARKPTSAETAAAQSKQDGLSASADPVPPSDIEEAFRSADAIVLCTIEDTAAGVVLRPAEYLRGTVADMPADRYENGLFHMRMMIPDPVSRECVLTLANPAKVGDTTQSSWSFFFLLDGRRATRTSLTISKEAARLFAKNIARTSSNPTATETATR